MWLGSGVGGVGPGRRYLERDKFKWHAKHLRGFFGEHLCLFVERIALAAQSPADHLLAEQLRTEWPQPHDMGDGIGVPALGQHGDRHHPIIVQAWLTLPSCLASS